MRITVYTNSEEGGVEKLVRDFKLEYPDADFETYADEEVPERCFPPLEDPVVQKIIIRVSVEIARQLFTQFLDRLEEETTERPHVSLSTIDGFAWHVIQTETNQDRDEFELENVRLPSEIGRDVCVYEFIGPEDIRYELEIDIYDLESTLSVV